MACGNCSCGRAEAEAMVKKSVKESEKIMYMEMAALSSCDNSQPASMDSEEFVGCGAGCACANSHDGG